MLPSVRRAVSAFFGSHQPSTSSDVVEGTGVSSEVVMAVNPAEDSEDVAKLLDELGAESPSKEASGHRQQSDMDVEGSSQAIVDFHHSWESPDVGQVLDELGEDSQSQGSPALLSRKSGQPAEAMRPAEEQAGVTSGDPSDLTPTGTEDWNGLGLELEMEMCSEDGRALAALPEWQSGYRAPPSSGSLSGSADGELQPGLGSGPTLQGGDPVCPPGAGRAALCRQGKEAHVCTRPGSGDPAAAVSAAEAERPAPHTPPEDQAVATEVLSDERPAAHEKTTSSQESDTPGTAIENQPGASDNPDCGSSQPLAVLSSESGTNVPGPSSMREEEVITISDNTSSSEEEEEEEESQSLFPSDGPWLRKRDLGPYRPRKLTMQSLSSRKKKKLGAPGPSTAAEKQAPRCGEVGHGDRDRGSSCERSGGSARRRLNQSPVPCTTARSRRRLGREERRRASENESSADASVDPGAAHATLACESGQRLILSFLTKNIRMSTGRGPDEAPAQSSRPSRSPDLEAQENGECIPESPKQCDSTQLSVRERRSAGDPAPLPSGTFNADDILNYARLIGISESSFFASCSSDSQEDDLFTRREPAANPSVQPNVPAENSAGADEADTECNDGSVNFTAEEILDYMRQVDLAMTLPLAGMWKGSPRNPRPEHRGLTFTASHILEFQRQMDIPATIPRMCSEVSPVLERRLPLHPVTPDNGSEDCNLQTLQLPQELRCQMLACLDQSAK